MNQQLDTANIFIEENVTTFPLDFENKIPIGARKSKKEPWNTHKIYRLLL